MFSFFTRTLQCQSYHNTTSISKLFPTTLNIKIKSSQICLPFAISAGIYSNFYYNTQIKLNNNYFPHFIPTVHAHTYNDGFRIGALPKTAPRPVLEHTVHGGLTPLDFRPFRCSDINVVSEDTCLYFFNLTSPNQSLNLPVSSYVLAKQVIDGETVIRPYTPIANFTGELPLLVKSYNMGKMGTKFAFMEVGDTLHFKGPFQTFQYEKNLFDRVTLVAGGTGISPMFQLIDKILTDPQDRTKIHLIYSNKTEKDILLFRELRELSDSYPNRLKITYFVDAPIYPERWSGLTGYINKEVLMAVVGKPHPHSKIFVCMPPAGLEYIAGAKGENYSQGPVEGLLGELGFTEREVWKF